MVGEILKPTPLPDESFARNESESGIIATLIKRPEFSFRSENPLPNHFFNKENRYIYRAICECARRRIAS